MIDGDRMVSRVRQDVNRCSRSERAPLRLIKVEQRLALRHGAVLRVLLLLRLLLRSALALAGRGSGGGWSGRRRRATTREHLLQPTFAQAPAGVVAVVELATRKLKYRVCLETRQSLVAPSTVVLTLLLSCKGSGCAKRRCVARRRGWRAGRSRTGQGLQATANGAHGHDAARTNGSQARAYAALLSHGTTRSTRSLNLALERSAAHLTSVLRNARSRASNGRRGVTPVHRPGPLRMST